MYWFVNEMASLERDPEETSARAAYNTHDDRIIAMCFALFSLTVDLRPRQVYKRSSAPAYLPESLEDAEPMQAGNYATWSPSVGRRQRYVHSTGPSTRAESEGAPHDGGLSGVGVEGETIVALIDVTCKSCGTVSEVYRAAKDHPWTPPCPKCDDPNTEQIHLPNHIRNLPPAVVVYKAPDGTFRYPGSTEGLSTHNYDKMGYQRIEARGWAEVRRLEGTVNKQEASKIRQHVERQCEARVKAGAGRAAPRRPSHHGAGVSDP